MCRRKSTEWRYHWIHGGCEKSRFAGGQGEPSFRHIKSEMFSKCPGGHPDKQTALGSGIQEDPGWSCKYELQQNQDSFWALIWWEGGHWDPLGMSQQEWAAIQGQSWGCPTTKKGERWERHVKELRTSVKGSGQALRACDLGTRC